MSTAEDFFFLVSARIFCILSRRITASRMAISALPPVSSCIFEAEQTAFAQGWLQAHCRPHARGAHGDDCLL